MGGWWTDGEQWQVSGCSGWGVSFNVCMLRLELCSTSACSENGATAALTWGQREQSGPAVKSLLKLELRLDIWSGETLWCDWSEAFTSSLHWIREVQRQGCGLSFENKLSALGGSGEPHTCTPRCHLLFDFGGTGCEAAVCTQTLVISVVQVGAH